MKSFLTFIVEQTTLLGNLGATFKNQAPHTKNALSTIGYSGGGGWAGEYFDNVKKDLKFTDTLHARDRHGGIFAQHSNGKEGHLALVGDHTNSDAKVYHPVTIQYPHAEETGISSQQRPSHNGVMRQDHYEAAHERGLADGIDLNIMPDDHPQIKRLTTRRTTTRDQSIHGQPGSDGSEHHPIHMKSMERSEERQQIFPELHPED
tara:strand:+ start:1552 stop:2166 length:615 start_codon:yes stop_codon:yes gene_type:complete